MKILLLLLGLSVLFWQDGSACADTLSAYDSPGNIITTPGNNSLSRTYLKQARSYRAAGRYELARQSYAQALAVCADTKSLDVIRRELAGVELLIRNMR